MTFETAYEEFRAIDPKKHRKALAKCSKTVDKSKIKGAEERFLLMIKGTIAADGVYDEKEYEAIRPKLLDMFVRVPTYEEHKDQFKDRELDPADIEDAKQAFKTYPEEVRDAMMLACMILADSDGFIADAETRWIKSFDC